MRDLEDLSSWEEKMKLQSVEISFLQMVFIKVKDDRSQ